MQQADAPLVLLIDVDMTLPENMLEAILGKLKDVRRGLVLKPILRRVPDLKFDASSPNVHLMHREDFLAVKGYDLTYCGHKGWSDVTLLHVLSRAYKIRKVDDLWLWLHHGSDDIDDAQVTRLDRNTSRNRKVHMQHIRDIQRMGVKKWVETKHTPMVELPWSKVR